MKNNGNSSSGGVGFLGLLTIVFIVLKLLRVIDWKWIWVLAPSWIACLLIIVAVVIGFWLGKKR